MKFKHKITKEIVTIRNGDQDHVWYTKDSDPKKTLLLLEAEVFFAEYESLNTSKKKKETA